MQIITKKNQIVELTDVRDVEIKLSTGTYLFQNAFGDGRCYQRKKVAGEWGKWKVMLTDLAPVDSMPISEINEL